MASYYMEMEDLVWVQDAKETWVFTSWDSFARALHIKYSAYDDAMEALTRLRQTINVVVYTRVNSRPFLTELQAYMKGTD